MHTFYGFVLAANVQNNHNLRTVRVPIPNLSFEKLAAQSGDCLSVCLSVLMIFPQRVYDHQASKSKSFSYLFKTPIIMNYTNQEIVIQ